MDADADRRRSTGRLLDALGFHVVGEEGAGDVVILHADRLDDDALARIRAVGQQRAIVLLTEDSESESVHRAVAAGVNAYVVIGVNGNRLRAAIDLAKANFAAQRGLREELDEARAALRDRKIIEKAKGLIMKSRGLDEEAAYELLRNQAMRKAVRMVDIARTVTDAAEVLG